MAKRLTIDVPGLVDRRKLKGADLDNYRTRREVHGPTYQMVPSDQHHAGDPQQQLALRQPDPYQHPQHLGRYVLDPGGPRIMPVSQKIQPGDEPSRIEEFDRPCLIDLLPSAPRIQDQDVEFWLGNRQAADLGRMHRFAGLGPDVGLRPGVYRDRRFSGRRHRPTDSMNDLLGPQQPYATKAWQADVNTPDKLQRGW